MQKLTSAMRLSNGKLGQPGIISVLLFLALTTPAQATVWFVKKTGSDSNTCSQAKSESSPKRTIQSALNCIGSADGAGAGHTVRVFAGTYAEVFQGKGDVPGGTSWSSPFRLEANPGDTVKIQPTAGTGFHVINLAASTEKYIIIDGFIIDGNEKAGISDGNGVKVQDSAHHIRVQNTEIRQIPGSGILVSKTAHHVELKNVVSHNNGAKSTEHGVYFSGRDNRVEDSRFFDNAGFGIHIYSGSRAAHRNVARRNITHGNAKYGMVIGSGDDNLAYNNISFGNAQGGILVGFSNAIGTKVYNNTMFNNGGPCIKVKSSSTSALVKNNVCWQDSGGITDGGKDSTLEANLAGQDPLFADAANDDFHLQSGSPAIDAGVTISEVPHDFDGVSRPQGRAYDIGAYEHQGSQSSQSPPPTPPSNLSVTP